MLVGVVAETRSNLSSPPLSKMCLRPCSEEWKNNMELRKQYKLIPK